MQHQHSPSPQTTPQEEYIERQLDRLATMKLCLEKMNRVHASIFNSLYQDAYLHSTPVEQVASILRLQKEMETTVTNMVCYIEALEESFRVDPEKHDCIVLVIPPKE